MNENLFIAHYEKQHRFDEGIQLCVKTIKVFEKYVGKDIEDTSIQDIKRYMKHLKDIGANKLNSVIHIARYYYYVDMKDHYIFMTRYFNSLGVLEHIIERISLVDSDIKEDVIAEMELPPFGTETKDLPRYITRFLSIINEKMDKETCNKVLAGNNHQLPASALDKEKEYYDKASTFKEYLADRHKRKIQELHQYYEDNKVWFEQIITPEVIDYVRDNPEILSGVVKGDKLYITKIPYDVSNFLHTNDEVMKRYYSCHCSFVRDNLIRNEEDIPKQWCYCSAGFAKYPFEVLLGEELDVKLVSTPLDGDELCRFEIDLSGVNYKK